MGSAVGGLVMVNDVTQTINSCYLFLGASNVEEDVVVAEEQDVTVFV